MSNHWRYLCDVDTGPLATWIAIATWPLPSTPTKPQRIQEGNVPLSLVGPIIECVLTVLPGQPYRPMLSRLLPGQSHPWHVDNQRADWLTRVHVPITTNPGAWLAWEDDAETIEAKISHGDITKKTALPSPFKSADGKKIGDVAAVHFDGKNTVATVLLHNRAHFEAGKAYTFDTLARHAFGNDGQTERVHLIFDVLRKDG